MSDNNLQGIVPNLAVHFINWWQTKSSTVHLKYFAIQQSSTRHLICLPIQHSTTK